MISIYLIDFRNIKKMNETEMDETYRARARARARVFLLLFYYFTFLGHTLSIDSLHGFMIIQFYNCGS